MAFSVGLKVRKSMVDRIMDINSNKRKCPATFIHFKMRNSLIFRQNVRRPGSDRRDDLLEIFALFARLLLHM